MSNKQDEKLLGLDASFLLREHDNNTGHYPIGEIEIRPREQSRLSLGTFHKNKPPKGFVIDITPEPIEDSIVTQVTRLESGAGGASEELILHIANYGDKTICAEVRQL